MLSERAIMFVDSYERVIDYLRLSITSRCNFKCPYCRPHGEKSDVEELSLDDLFKIASFSIDQGIKKIRITGGEPCLRPDLAELLSMIHRYSPSTQINLTTNGFNLESIAGKLAQSGLRQVNVSLDTLDRTRFAKITHNDSLQAVLGGIEHALKSGLRVKVNMVPMKGVNDDEITDLFDYCRSRGIMIRYIEYMENIIADKSTRGLRSFEILERLKGYTFRESEEKYFGAATLYHTEDGYQFGIIEPHGEEFCKKCNRIRVTSDGKIIPCLYHDESHSIKKALREDDTKLLYQTFEHAIREKPEKNHWCQESGEISKRAFFETGG